MYLWGLLCQHLDEFAAVEAAVEVWPPVTRGGCSYTAFSAKERLAVPKKLLACNTKLQLLRDHLIGYSENEAQLEAFVHPTKVKPFFVHFHSF